MYRTTSVMALGLFLGLAPIGALAQTDTDDTQTQQMTQPTETEQNTGTGAMGTDDQQATDTETLDTDDQQATDTDTLQTDDQQATDTDTLQTDDQQATDTDTLQTDDQQAVETETMETDDQQATETETLDAEEPEVATDAEEVPDVIAEQDESEMLASSLMGASVNLADESIGTVSDLIIGDDHTVKGVVVGVGGFLGIGEKRVALPLERLTVQTPEPGLVELTANMTREELEEKEAFRTAADIRQEEEAAQAEQQQQTMQPETLE